MHSPSAANQPSRRPSGEAARVIMTHPIPRQVLLVRNPIKAVFTSSTINRRNFHQQNLRTQPTARTQTTRVIGSVGATNASSRGPLENPPRSRRIRSSCPPRVPRDEKKHLNPKREMECNRDIDNSTKIAIFPERTNVRFRRFPDSRSNKP